MAGERIEGRVITYLMLNYWCILTPAKWCSFIPALTINQTTLFNLFINSLDLIDNFHENRKKIKIPTKISWKR